MTNINYAVSVTSGSIGDLPGYIQDWKINTVDLISTGGASNTYASELAYIKSLKLTPRLDIEMDIWAGGQIQSGISNFAGYLQNLKAAGWPAVSSEGGRAGDANYIKSIGLNYVNYNCDQCGLWSAGLHTEAGTVMNLWEAYYPSEVSYIQQAAGYKPNGVLAGAWADNGGDNAILSNSLSGGTPSYKSMFDWFVANGHPIDTFEVWGGTNSSRSENSALGFDGIVSNLQKYYPANGAGPTPPPTPTTVTFASAPAACSWGSTRLDLFVEGSDKACWHGYSDTGTNLKWESKGGVLTSAPAAAARAGKLIDVFVRGNDSACWHLQWNGSAWSKWVSLGGGILAGTGPTVAAKDANSLDVFVIGTDKELYRKSLTGTVWSAWIREAAGA